MRSKAEWMSAWNTCNLLQLTHLNKPRWFWHGWHDNLGEFCWTKRQRLKICVLFLFPYENTHHRISWTLSWAKFVYENLQLIINLAGISTAMLSSCLPNLWAIEVNDHMALILFSRCYNEMSFEILKQPPGSFDFFAFLDNSYIRFNRSGGWWCLVKAPWKCQYW